ncbi:uncharacterized protein CDAR_104411 [Caerostris darwini]|uniref:Uncharacterized protein n=1 Tax=Caerostris darwini TaxID=1538125 RepID=A0AAV4PUH0_9ARAC|nr:uncharacterized protein CDAR_104411 [Caerostris darwini]
MALPTLYDMCQSQTIVNMRAGLWSQCQENPFTRVPPKLVDKLREFIFSMNFRQLPNHEALHLLFTSHRLKKLDLSCFVVQWGETFSADDPYAPPHLKENIDIHVPMNEGTGDEYINYRPISPNVIFIYMGTKTHMEDECNSLLYMVSKDPKQDLQSFVMTKEITISKFALHQLIQVSTHLTEIHTYIRWFDLNVLLNCKMLRILRLHNSPETSSFDCPKVLLETCENVLPSLQNLQIFTICNNSKVDCFFIRPLIAIALDHCPKLTSVGHFDSAMAIDFIRAKADRSHIEELILQVVNKDCLQHLRRLKRLNSLVLECDFCLDFDIDECLSSLGEIRHQLKHFVIKGLMLQRCRIPLNIVTDNCENLETLGVTHFSEINFSLKITASFRRLKRMCIFTRLDCLGQILRYCGNLTYLLMIGHFKVDESELRENLSHTSALKLQTLGIRSSDFTRNAMRMIFEKAPNLERVYFFHKSEWVSLFKELGRSIVFADELLHDDDYFPPELQPCLF